jgi:hypothetical protein
MSMAALPLPRGRWRPGSGRFFQNHRDSGRFFLKIHRSSGKIFYKPSRRGSGAVAFFV